MPIFKTEISYLFCEQIGDLFGRETLCKEDFELSLLIAGYNQIKTEMDHRDLKGVE